MPLLHTPLCTVYIWFSIRTCQRCKEIELWSKSIYRVIGLASLYHCACVVGQVCVTVVAAGLTIFTTAPMVKPPADRPCKTGKSKDCTIGFWVEPQAIILVYDWIQHNSRQEALISGTSSLNAFTQSVTVPEYKDGASLYTSSQRGALRLKWNLWRCSSFSCIFHPRTCMRGLLCHLNYPFNSKGTSSFCRWKLTIEVSLVVEHNVNDCTSHAWDSSLIMIMESW